MADKGNTVTTVEAFKSEVEAFAQSEGIDVDGFAKSEVFVIEFGGFYDLDRPVDDDVANDMATDAVIDAFDGYSISTDVSDYFNPVVDRLVEQIRVISQEMKDAEARRRF